MDKRSYNVDDILADIKSRKARQKKQMPDVPPAAPSKPERTEELRVHAPRATDKPSSQYIPTVEHEERPAKPSPQYIPPVEHEARPAKPSPQYTPAVEHEARPAKPSPPYIPPAERETRQAKPPEEKKPSRRLEFGSSLPNFSDKARTAEPYTDAAELAGITNPAKDLVGDTATSPRPRPGRPVSRLSQPETPKPSAAVETSKAATAPSTRGGDAPTRVLPKVRDLKAGDVKSFDFGKFALEREPESRYDEEEDSLPEGSVVDYSEYNSISDRRDVQRDIAHVKLWLFFRVTATFILTVALFIFTLSGRYESIPLPEALWPVAETMRAYLMACTVLTILIALVGSSSVGGGLIGLFRGHANSDTLAALAILAAIGQGVSAVPNHETVEPDKLNLYFCVAALAMLFNGLGKLKMINRILSNFKIIADDNEPKKALLSVEDDDFCHEFVKDASSRRPVIAYNVNAGFFSDFLALSYSDKYDVGINRAVAPVCIVGAVVVGATTYFLTGSVFSGISALCAVLCVCATLSSTFIENVPLSKLTKKLAPDGGMVSGHKAVEDFCDTQALILTETDLFPKGNVRMHGIRAFSNTRVDEAILDAASVLCSVDGTLGPVFLEMIGGNQKLLKKVDNIIFENGMGVSAWVDQRRVLIGNRKLMLNHGITLPPEAAAQKHSQLSSEAEPLFLSNSGEASAQFTVSYHIDEDLATQLDRMSTREMLLIVKTMDANITVEKIWEMYGYPMDLIRILPAEWHPVYNKISAPRKNVIAEIVCPADKPSVFVKAILACVAARSSILSATVIQLIQIVLGYALVTFMAFMGSIGSISITEICLYQLFWFVAIFIAQKVRQS